MRKIICLFSLSQHLGDSTKTLQDISSGKHPFSKELASAKSPMVIVGSGALQRPDADALHSTVTTIANSVSKPDSKDWRTLNVLQRVGQNSICYEILSVV
jgi:hypothetical protein